MERHVVHTVKNEGRFNITVYTWEGDRHIIMPGEAFTANIRSIEHGERSAQYTVKSEEK